MRPLFILGTVLPIPFSIIIYADFFDVTALIINNVPIIRTIPIGRHIHALLIYPAIIYETNETAATVKAYGN